MRDYDNRLCKAKNGKLRYSMVNFLPIFIIISKLDIIIRLFDTIVYRNHEVKYRIYNISGGE